MSNRCGIFFLFVFIFSSLPLFANGDDWVIQIKDRDGNIKSTFTVDSFKGEVSNFATFSGINKDYIDLFFTNANERWRFASELIEQELLYIQAMDAGFDKSPDLLAKIENERDKQIAQLYSESVISSEALNVTDTEKLSYWNREKSKIQAMAGANVTYEQVAREIEGAIIQEKMKGEYDKIIVNARTKYNIKYSSVSDPCITIDEKKIPLKKFDDAFNQALQSLGGADINQAMRVQARDNMFNAFLAREIMVYEASKSGFYDTPEAKSIENFIKRSAVVQSYVQDTIRAKVEKSSEEEINEAYKKYGKAYRIDTLPFAKAQEALDTIVKETKAQNELEVLVKNLRYSYSINKRLELLSK